MKISRMVSMKPIDKLNSENRIVIITIINRLNKALFLPYYPHAFSPFFSSLSLLNYLNIDILLKNLKLLKIET